MRRRAGVRLWPPLWLIASRETGELRPWAVALFALLRRARTQSWGERILTHLADLLVEIDGPSVAFVGFMAWWAVTGEQRAPPPAAELEFDPPASVAGPAPPGTAS